MVSLDQAVVARLNRFGIHFEVLVDPDGAEALRERLVALDHEHKVAGHADGRQDLRRGDGKHDKHADHGDGKRDGKADGKHDKHADRQHGDAKSAGGAAAGGAAEASADLAPVTDDDLAKILAVEDVFIEWASGTRASRDELLTGFETTHVPTIARRILAEGDIQLTTQQRQRMLENKRKRIIDYIARHAWNPQTKMPHPRDRIERALEEAKFAVDAQRRVEDQVTDAMKRIRPLIPIAFERVRVAVKIPAEHTGHAYGQLRGLGDLQKEEWQRDGSLVVLIEIPAGAQTEVYERLNHLTHGHVETKLLTK